MEEAEEVARAAREESDERVDEEAADVLYHLLVLLHSSGRRLADVEQVLMPVDVSPTLAEVVALAAEHNLIPLRHEFVADCETPVSAFLKLRARDRPSCSSRPSRGSGSDATRSSAFVPAR